MGKFFSALGAVLNPFRGITAIVKDAKHEGGMFGHNSKLSNFWHDTVEPYATEAWNALSGKTDRDFAREQADTAFERQKWLIENQPSMEADARKRAGYSTAFSGSNIGTVSTPQMASANRLSPSLGDLGGLFNGLFANILSAKKTEAEVNNLQADTEKKGTESALNVAKVDEVRSICKVNNQTAQNLVATYDNIVAENNVLQSQDLLNLSLASLHDNQRETERWKQMDYDSQIQHRTKQDEGIDWTIKQIKYNLEVFLPRQVDLASSQIGLNEAKTEQVKQATNRILQDILLNRPNVAHAVQNMSQIVDTLGVQNSLKYFMALSQIMDSKIDISKKSKHPALNLNTGNKVNDAAGNVYVMIMSLIQNISSDLTSGIGAGLGIGKLLGK